MQLNYELIAFDLDGTLLDSVPDLTLAAQKTLAALGFPSVAEEQVRDYVGNGADILIARALSQNIEIDPSITESTKKEARKLFDHYYAKGGHALSHLYPGVRETLYKLHEMGLKLALVTNKPSEFVPEILKQHQIEHFFIDCLGGDAFAEKKPNPVGLHWLMTQHNITPQKMLMVGDSKNDILAAKNAGCLSFGLTYGYNHGEPISLSNPDFVADNISELIGVVAACTKLEQHLF
ncbi:phosphoglycolate phosphatase [Vibrio caribbeanicus]|uniref:Phosphoglycolate phosphatase n=1 Tax=Vibrio caribbeanicus ATCC BAA-2122 TaxID=796620 RepID=E3BIQ6_9VIBR|nr:phosphoglycolate phosphatase [Vibrio caribbeanicus]EFP97093.1 phosphoglycolate phosphatase [Vibrio caribbeanicus ATCC BAA-2122]